MLHWVACGLAELYEVLGYFLEHSSIKVRFHCYKQKTKSLQLRNYREESWKFKARNWQEFQGKVKEKSGVLVLCLQEKLESPSSPHSLLSHLHAGVMCPPVQLKPEKSSLMKLSNLSVKG